VSLNFPLQTLDPFRVLLNCKNGVVHVANEPHVDNRHSSYAPNPKFSSLKFHTTFASTHQNVCSLVFIDDFCDTPWLVDYFLWRTITIVVNSHCLKVCTMHPTCFNTRHQIFMFNSRKTMFTFKFHLSSNIPPSGKREVFASFALITCNVVSWNIWCVVIFISVNQRLYNCYRN
jgi:hypothetical protein